MPPVATITPAPVTATITPAAPVVATITVTTPSATIS